MLKDLTRTDWLSILELQESDVPQSLILRGTRNLKTKYEIYRSLFTDVREIGSPNGLFEDILIGSLSGRRVGYASVYGPAMASEIVHVFGVLGTELVVQTGVCGGLADGVEAGHMIVATEAGCGDGASQCYAPNRNSVRATDDLVERVVGFEREGMPLHTGPIWTTSALLAEGDAEITAWHAAGYVAVDMETATTFAVAEYFGMRRISILSVYDNPRDGAHLGLTEHHKRDARARGEAAALKLVLEMAAHA